MPTRTAYPARPHRGPLRSPLAPAPHSPLPEHRTGASLDRSAAHAGVPDPRSVTLDEFDEYLRTVNNRDGRPYEEATIHAYVYPVLGHRRVGTRLRDGPRPRDHPDPALRGHPPAGTARHGHAHPPRRSAQKSRFPPGAAQRRPERRGRAAGEPGPGHRPRAGCLPSYAPLSRAR